MDITALDKLAGEIDRPDDNLRAEAITLLRGARDGSLGRLSEAAGWLASVSGRCPPRAPRRPRLLVFTPDGSIPAMTERIVATSERSVHATPADAGTEDPAEALARGVELADAEADSGTDLLLLAAPTPAALIPAAVVIAAITGSDAPSVIGHGNGDAEWMRGVAGVRDGLRRVKVAPPDPISLLTAAGGTEVAHLSGVLLGAVARRTPVVIEGITALAAALIAYRVSDATAGWILPAHTDHDPASAAALRHLGLTPLLDLGIDPGDGIPGALVAAMLDVAAATFAAGGHTVP